ncbi:MAG: hypothetical protein M1834_008053 [Cirrosporium novae-zelandiae]|nr:MAG: hypothetical protein M1834_008053 [Cirrosporium novae-zelandiae]
MPKGNSKAPAGQPAGSHETFQPHGLITTISLEASYRLAEDPQSDESATTALMENILNKVFLNDEPNIYLAIIDCKKSALPQGIRLLENQLLGYIAEFFGENPSAPYLWAGAAFGGRVRLWSANKDGPNYINVSPMWPGNPEDIAHYYDVGDNTQGQSLYDCFKTIVANKPSLPVSDPVTNLPSIEPDGTVTWNEAAERFFYVNSEGQSVWCPFIRTS